MILLLQVSVTGELSISFYDIEAGTKVLKPIKIPPRSNPQITEVDVDASNLPTGNYLSLDACKGTSQSVEKQTAFVSSSTAFAISKIQLFIVTSEKSPSLGWWTPVGKLWASREIILSEYLSVSEVKAMCLLACKLCCWNQALRAALVGTRCWLRVITTLKLHQITPLPHKFGQLVL